MFVTTRGIQISNMGLTCINISSANHETVHILYPTIKMSICCIARMLNYLHINLIDSNLYFKAGCLCIHIYTQKSLPCIS